MEGKQPGTLRVHATAPHPRQKLWSSAENFAVRLRTPGCWVP